MRAARKVKRKYREKVKFFTFFISQPISGQEYQSISSEKEAASF